MSDSKPQAPEAPFPPLTAVSLFRLVAFHPVTGCLSWYGVTEDELPDISKPEHVPAGKALLVERFRLDLAVPDRPRFVMMRANGSADHKSTQKSMLRLMVEKDPIKGVTVGGIWSMPVEDAVTTYCVGAACLSSQVIKGTKNPNPFHGGIPAALEGLFGAHYVGTIDARTGQLIPSAPPQAPEPPADRSPFGRQKKGEA